VDYLEPNSNILTGSVRVHLFRFFLPIWFGSLFQQLYFIADAAIVGHFAGKIALAALGGTTSQVLEMSLGFFIGASAGAGVVVAQFCGAKDMQRLRSSIQIVMLLSFISGIVLTIFGFLFTPLGLRLLNTPADVFPDASTYLMVYFCGAIPAVVYNMGSAVLRAVGDSKRPMYFLAFSTFLNILLDFIFVAGLKAGVSGAAWATVISQSVSAVLVIALMIHTKDDARLTFTPSIDYRKILFRTLCLAIPSGLQYILFSISNLLVQSRINLFPTDVIAGWTIYGRMNGIYWLTLASFGTAVTTFIGQNYGAQKYDRVNKCVRESSAMSVVITIVIALPLLIFTRPLLSIFTPDTAVLDAGVHFVRVLVPAFIVYPFTDVFNGVIRGIGNSFAPMMIYGISFFAFRSLWTIIVPHFVTGTDIVILGYPLSWLISSGLFLLYFHFSRDVRHRLDSVHK